MHNGIEVEKDELVHYFALRQLKSATDIYRKQFNRGAKSEFITEKPVVFCGRLEEECNILGEKLPEFLVNLQCLALKAYPEESKEVRGQLVECGPLEAIYNCQVRLDLGKSLVDAALTIKTVLEKTLHPETVTRNDKEKRQPKSQFFNPKKNRE